MTLRRRLVLAGISGLVITGLACLGVALLQRQYVLGQLDARVTSLVGDTKALLAVANKADGGNAAAATLLSEAYVGVLRADGRLRTVVAPTDDPQLSPRLLGNERGAGPVPRTTTAGRFDRVRVEVVPLDAGRALVVAVSMEPVEQSTGRLWVGLGLAWVLVAISAVLVGYWVDRHGLRPIAQLTDAAVGVTASGGRQAVQVEVADPATEAGRLGQAFNTMVATTADGQEQLRRFVADAGHELRTPLTTLQGYSALYAAGGLADEAAVADAMRRINAEATRMNRIVADLLDLAQLGDRSALSLQRVDVGLMVNELAADLRVREPDRDVRVEVGGAGAVIADSDRLRQAVTALIENAVKYSDPGTPISLVAQGGARVRISVTDSGRGIPAADLDRVFDRFYRTSVAGPRGSGLGLAIVAAIIAAHGGSYGVDSVLGHGSTFWVEVPSSNS
ncbi:MAG: HAMP domain-containing histidine kinase [Propionibacteriales bacterium]|nr:HAMP domain-containing histidine kinase [Propionibacteriales bacterium]